jgi:hypothetical protein
MNLRKIDDNLVSFAFNETCQITDLDDLLEIFKDLKAHSKTSEGFLHERFYEGRQYKGLPDNLKRTSEFMQQPQFTQISSET